MRDRRRSVRRSTTIASAWPIVTAGPGGTNAITGVAGAWLDSTPVLVISGQVKRADLKGDTGVRNMGPQELDLPTLVSSITKYAVTVTDPATIRYHLEKAVHRATSGRPGPAWLEIPLDVQAAQVEPESLAGYEPPRADGVIAASRLAGLVHDTLDLLAAAERPFLLFGNGVRLAGARDDMRRLVDALRIPFGLTWPASISSPDDHPGLVGRPGGMAPRAPNFALQNADFVLFIGARLDLVCTAFAPEQPRPRRREGHGRHRCRRDRQARRPIWISVFVPTRAISARDARPARRPPCRR